MVEVLHPDLAAGFQRFGYEDIRRLEMVCLILEAKLRSLGVEFSAPEEKVLDMLSEAAEAKTAAEVRIGKLTVEVQE